MEDFFQDGQELENIKGFTRKNKKALNRSEESIQVSLVSYIKSKYPNAVFRFAPEGLRMSIGLAVKSKKQGLLQTSLPDCEIFHPSGVYHALFLELKKGGFKLRKANGSLYKNEHVSEQRETLLKLQSSGYAVSFAVGLAHSKLLIDTYFNEPEKFQQLVIL